MIVATGSRATPAATIEASTIADLEPMKTMLQKFPTRRAPITAFILLLLCFSEHAVSQTATKLDRLSPEDYSQIADKKGIVLIAVNWNRRWKCAGYDNAQLKSIAFDRLPVAARADDAPADLLLDDAPLILTTPGFDEYAFVVEPGEYALSSFDVKVARSFLEVSGRKATRGQLIKDGRALGGSFKVDKGEIVYIGHFFLDCFRQPIPWRYYSDGPDEFRKYLDKMKSRYSSLEIGKVQYRLFRTSQFGNNLCFDAGLRAEVSHNWPLAEENYEQCFIESRSASTPDSERSMAMYNLGRIKGYLCKFDDAKKLLADALTLEEAASPESGLVTKRLFELGRLHLDRGESK
jgi:hypothetical protein